MLKQANQRQKHLLRNELTKMPESCPENRGQFKLLLNYLSEDNVHREQGGKGTKVRNKKLNYI